jgi:type II secretion system protein G
VKEKRRGFTLLELLTVMVIITILSGLGFKGYRLARRQAKESHATADLEKLRTALNEYRIQHDSYPIQNSPNAIRTLPEINVLMDAVEGLDLVDPWGNDYQYSCTNRFLYRLWSDGPDSETDVDDIDPAKTGY